MSVAMLEPLIIDELNNLLDTQALKKQLSSSADDTSSNTLSILKQVIVNIDDGLKTIYQNKNATKDTVNTVVYGRSYLIDQLIHIIYDNHFSCLKQKMALVAVGGYGRGELHPKSDIDLMLLLKEQEIEETKTCIERFFMLLWDIGLEIGHSVRTIKECIEESTNDITVATNIMESRLLSGDETLLTEMKLQTNADHIWDSKSFFQAKLEEQIQRNGKYNDTAYNLEPNIKESHGGLRDIQMIGWVAKRHFNAESLHDLVKENFLLEDELKTLLEGQNLLWRIRCSLHYLAGRREDRLLFDYQRDLAYEFGFRDSENNTNNEAIENFMQQYYRTVIELERLNEMLLQHFREAIIYADVPQRTERINNSFQVSNGYLETTNDHVFSDDPCAILEMFAILQDYREIQGVRAATIREIRQHKHLINDDVRQSSQAQKIFLRIMNHPRGVTHELRRMNRYGILAAYIPAFDSIVGRMQYDLFHDYTVDQHTLFVIRNMRRLSVPDFCHEFPLASGVFQHLPNPGLLYFSGLFHDIAKGRKGDHSTLGAVDAKEFCALHGLAEKDSDLVSWLVNSHLIMSTTAQRKDLSDPDVIGEFADHVATVERLDYLYLLTISDIRGTNPKQWNDWKDKLLSELYNKAASVLNKSVDQRSDKESNIQAIQTDALRQLEQMGIDSHQAKNFWQTLNTEYFQSHTASEIVWHTALINEARVNQNKQKQTREEPLIQTRIDDSSNSIELLVYMKDRGQIFYDIVTLLSYSEVDIVTAQIAHTSNDYALETFRLLPINLDNSEITYAADEITARLKEKLFNNTETTHSTSSISSKHKYFSAPTIITFKNIDNDTASQIKIETMDRTGILAIIAKAFADSSVKILNARVAAAGEKAIDYFTISTPENTALSKTQKNNLKQTLQEQL
jgi:[protein-PII] uridylyltransferase